MLTSLPWAAWSVLLSVSVLAADPAPSAVTRVADADADFALQGEYTGSYAVPGGCQSVGLQVVALGKGEFQALLYPGGLPGNGYTGGPKLTLKGTRDQAVAVLSGEHLRVKLQAGQPAVVEPLSGGFAGSLQRWERQSPTTGARPPAGARNLFDGTDTGLLKNVQISPDGYLQIGAETREPVGDFILHGEFKTPYMPLARSQARGNSGFYLQRRYEVQVLDSFGMEPAVNEAASLYKFKAPDLNMSFPPLSWQTYDIHFTAARFDAAGNRIAKAHITVWHNGVVVQNNVALENKTGGGRAESPELLPILLQNHGNPVEYRNVWLVDLQPSTCPATCHLTCCVQPEPKCSPRVLRRGWRRCR